MGTLALVEPSLQRRVAPCHWAVQYGTTQVFSKIVPHFDAQELRQYIHQVMATFSKTGKEVVMVVERSGIHREHQLDASLDHYKLKSDR